ncbi:MAG TPA: peptidylprolyl isomerase [Bellilinea sp.]|nr:peptidylprolyl isomerase [Bellilinea sp.]
MPSPKLKKIIAFGLFTAFVLAALSGCRSVTPQPRDLTATAEIPAQTDTPAATATVTPTPEPGALMVNGESVPLSEFDAQLKQLQAADAELAKTRTPEEQRQMVLDELIDQTLLAQAAYAAGFVLDDAGLQQRIDALAADLGGQAALDGWITTMGHTSTSFQSALRRAAASAWQRDTLMDSVSESAEQVNAQQILVRSPDTAADILRRLNAGAEFATLAAEYDPITKGILGWFPHGYLTQPKVEEAAFGLEPGAFSAVIETDFGYHIVYVLERENDRTLSVDARLTLQHKAIENWLVEQRAAATVEILVP